MTMDVAEIEYEALNFAPLRLCVRHKFSPNGIPKPNCNNRKKKVSRKGAKKMKDVGGFLKSLPGRFVPCQNFL